MPHLHSSFRIAAAVAALLLAGSARAEVVIEQWGPDERCSHPRTLKVSALEEGNPPKSWRIDIDLSALPRGAKVYRASLLAQREPLDGRDERVLVNVDIRPAGAARPLQLEGPWFASFDTTETVRRWVKDPEAPHQLLVKAFPGWLPGQTYLEIAYEGKAGKVPPQVRAVRAFHRAGQTFITFKEIADPLAGAEPTWGNVRSALEKMDQTSRVRYLVFRHTAPITAENIAEAQLLARLKPLSGYNIRGRSVEELIAMIRRRAIEDIPLARKLARRGLHYSPNSPEMAEVIIKRFAVEDGKVLEAGTGLYVHNPAKAGKGYYAVVASVNGTANLRDMGAGNCTPAVSETVGPGAPVRQPPADVTVFYDYPGKRIQYVQWTAPPLSNLPNQYYNWSVYIPPNPPRPTPIRVAFVDDRYIKPGVRHRPDTILISGHDRPIWSQWYGYHEALGTLKSFRQGVVRPYTKRRLFAFIDWAMREFGSDHKRLSAVGGTEALYYGVKHGEKFAYVLTDRPDPDPKLTPALVRVQNYRRRTARPLREAAWGKVQWQIPDESGKPVWDEFDLISYVAADPRRELAFISMGPAMLSAPWPQQVKFMKTLWQTKHGFTARFYWGGGRHLPIPEGKVGTRTAFDFALDIPFLALRNNSNDKGLNTRQFRTGAYGYGSGGRIADGRRWLADFVDEPDRFEITIHGQGRVSYAGGGTSDVTPRRTRNFKPAPGEKFRWENVPLGKSRRKPQSGQVVADEYGLVTIPQVNFYEPSRLKIYKVK